MSSSSSTSESSESLSSGGNILVDGIDLIPDCSGSYCLKGTCSDKPIYQRLDDKFMICWKETFGRWELIEFATAQYWFRNDVDIVGEFSPHCDVKGNPIISEK